MCCRYVCQSHHLGMSALAHAQFAGFRYKFFMRTNPMQWPWQHILNKKWFPFPSYQSVCMSGPAHAQCSIHSAQWAMHISAHRTVRSAHASRQPIPNYHARPLWREHRKYGINTKTNGWHWMHYTGVRHCIYGKINTCIILPLLLPMPRAAQIWPGVKFWSALMLPITLFVLHSENLIWLIVIMWL